MLKYNCFKLLLTLEITIIIVNTHLRVFLGCPVGTLGPVALVPHHLAVHLVVDLEQGHGDVRVLGDLANES